MMLTKGVRHVEEREVLTTGCPYCFERPEGPRGQQDSQVLGWQRALTGEALQRNVQADRQQGREGLG